MLTLSFKLFFFTFRLLKMVKGNKLRFAALNMSLVLKIYGILC